MNFFNSLLVKQSAERISSFLISSDEGQDKELLRSLFYLPEDGEGKHNEKKKTGGSKYEGGELDVDPSKPYLSIEKRDGGFVVRPHKDAKRTPDRIVIRAAYDIDRGNPFKAHHPADFDFCKQNGGIALALSGMEVEQSSPNRIVCRITHSAFEFSAAGFDPNRDLVVNVRPEIEPSEES